MKKIELKTPYLWLLLFLWMLYGMAIAYGISEGFLRAFSQAVWESMMRYVPSIWRIKDEYSFDVHLARQIASVIMLSMPILFMLMLPADVEESIHGARKKGTEIKALFIFLFLGSLIFVVGLGVTGLTRLFGRSMYGFSMKASLLIFLCTYLYRLAFCVAFKR